MEDLVEVELSRLILQPKGEQQYIHLRVLGEERAFPIVIGFYEAAEIHRKLSGDKFERPMTHDLIGRILFATEWTLRRVVINELSNNTFFACLDLVHGDEERIVDCRPSDAIALSTQLQAPIFVARQVLDQVAPEA
jgi:bifunctional DNase/RNase